MNERIEKIWTKVCQCEMPELDETCMTSQRRTKFAELIVKECMDIARDVGNISEPDDFALDRCYEIEQRIQDRFGVEE